jgi:flagellar biosynthetic protein FliO
MATEAHTGMFAAPQATPAAHPSAIGGLGEVAFALILVLAAIFVTAWLLRRMRIVGNRVGGAIDVLANVQLGQKERAVLLKVGSTQILLGVAPGQVSTLHVLTEPLEVTKPPAGPGGTTPSEPTSPAGPGAAFRNILLRSLGK